MPVGGMEQPHGPTVSAATDIPRAAAPTALSPGRCLLRNCPASPCRRGKLEGMSREQQHPPATQSSRAYGCLLGGALGDALGNRLALEGVPEPGGSAAETMLSFSGTTQLALYSLDGLLDALEWANAGTGADVNACIWLAYLRWYRAQEGSLPPSAPAPQPRWLDGQELLHRRRNPDAASLRGLATGDMGTSFRPVNPEAKGSAVVSRSAPFGLVPHIEAAMVYKISADAAALTHGHPAALQAAGLFSSLIHHVCAGAGLGGAAKEILDAAQQAEHPAPGLAERLSAARRLAAAPGTAPDTVRKDLGDGADAEGALAVGLYAVLATADGVDGPPTPSGHFRAAVSLASGFGTTGTAGDAARSAAGSIAGAILGAHYGEECLPREELDHLEGRDIIRNLADQLLKVTSAPE